MLQLLGIDFTSAPRPAKPITVACGHLDGARVVLDGFERCADWPSFEALLTRPGPWLGAFDFPFGLPREAIIDLGWPQTWPALVRHCAALGNAHVASVSGRYYAMDRDNRWARVRLAWDAIVESAVRRLRPIVLTAAAAVLAMIPLSRSVFFGPMAVAIMGGLIVATALTLLFLPALYAAWFRVPNPARS